MVEDNRYLENGISMIVNHNANQREKLNPTRIYLDNCYKYNHMYNEELLKDVREVNI